MTREPIPHLGGLPVHFTFLEGQFGFRCADCIGLCCRLAGTLAVTPAQETLLDELGAGLFVGTYETGMVEFSIGAGDCAALLNDGRCSIHAERGRLAKPALCALFPYCVLVRTAGFVAVSPHVTFVCPLSVDPRDGDDRVTQQQILSDLRHFSGDELHGFLRVEMPASGAVTWEGERRVLQIFNSFRGQATLAAATAAASGRLEDRIAEEVDQALRVLGARSVPDSPEQAAQDLPLIPTIRARHYDIPAEQLDIAIVLAGHAVRTAASRRRRPLETRAAATLFESFLPLAKLLARSCRPVRLDGPPARIPGGDPQVALESMLVITDIEKEPGGHTIAELVDKHVRQEGYRRVLVLRDLARAKLRFD